MDPTDVLQTYIDAVINKDIDKLMALYDEDLREFDAWDQWEADKQRLRENFEGWFEWLGEDHNHVHFNDVKIIENDKLAVIQGYAVFDQLNQQGELVESMKNRFTLALICENDSWKIWHEHFSIPVEMDGLKGILDED